VESFTALSWVEGDQFRVVAQNIVGDTWDYADPGFNEIVKGGFPTITAESISEVLDTTAPPVAPAAPTDLTAMVEVGPQVSLAWVDNANNETGFLIQRSTDGVNFSDLATVAADTINYVDTAVLAGTAYTYQVVAFNLGGSSAYSNMASATIPGPQGPAAPADLQANLQDVPLIDLSWVDNSLDETSFVIERSTDGTNFSALATVVANVTAYTDLAVLGGFTYTYRVAAVNANGTSAYVVSNSVLVPPDATPPAAPSNLSATNITQTTLRLNWQDNSNNETGFTIQIATNNTFTRNLVTINVGPNVTFSDITGLKRGTKYFFRVLAFNGFNGGAGPFPWSPVLNVTTLK
jgi:predicted phage tail protein